MLVSKTFKPTRFIIYKKHSKIDTNLLIKKSLDGSLVKNWSVSIWWKMWVSWWKSGRKFGVGGWLMSDWCIMLVTKLVGGSMNQWHVVSGGVIGWWSVICIRRFCNMPLFSEMQVWITLIMHSFKMLTFLKPKIVIDSSMKHIQFLVRT